MSFKRAIKHEAKLRMALAGIAGVGKTWTGLTLATAFGGPIALIDTEHGSACKYADQFTFDTLELSNFDPRHYISAIHEAEAAGYSVLIIDSLSHAWNCTCGALELVDTLALRNYKNNSFNAWGDVTPLQNKLIDTILASPLHVIVTLRTKTEYVVETVGGKSVPRKVGMAPVQRADVEYEFDIYAEMDSDHTLIVQKSRCPALSGQVIAKPDQRLAITIGQWLAGEPAPVVTAVSVSLNMSVRERLNALYPRAKRLGLCSSSAGFLDYIRLLFADPTLALCDVTLDHLATVEEDIAKHESDIDIETQQREADEQMAS